eukprot:CAMPEP_0116841548 /NCGR_PEP_ID=MMETSP0418-20121206/10999_1 /TAXON_ID=1158023 /ORGANISM="Astrosyne radiata, Strain 13vi08-1A" /LENGTH=289 /DNA_ID=CAMNT_0004472013 /DNA_START=163 /DNA_END=1032 /DNA_ORIENTATION=+
MAAKSAASALFEGDELWDPSWKEDNGEKTIKDRMGVEDPDLLLYSSWFCPFAQRAWITLEETKVNYRWVEIDPYEVDPSSPGGYTKKPLPLEEKRRLHPGFVEASPRGLVPAILDKGDKKVWDSLTVAEYIDAVYGGGQLLPSDPHERAMVRIWASHCSERIAVTFMRAMMTQDTENRKACLEALYQECRAFANAMVQDGGPFFLGDRFSLADIALASFWQHMMWVGPDWMGMELPKDDPAFERLQRWANATLTRPSVAATRVCRPRLVSTYSPYAKNTAQSDFTKNLK